MLINSVFVLFENLLSKEKQKVVAKAILAAQDIKEDSWNGKGYDKDDIMSAKEAVEMYELEDYFSVIVSDLNFFYWNDAQGFAETILKNKAKQ